LDEDLDRAIYPFSRRPKGVVIGRSSLRALGLRARQTPNIWRARPPRPVVGRGVRVRPSSSRTLSARARTGGSGAFSESANGLFPSRGRRVVRHAPTKELDGDLARRQCLWRTCRARPGDAYAQDALSNERSDGQTHARQARRRGRPEITPLGARAVVAVYRGLKSFRVGRTSQRQRGDTAVVSSDNRRHSF
jgi:hypothetical protein